MTNDTPYWTELSYQLDADLEGHQADLKERGLSDDEIKAFVLFVRQVYTRANIFLNSSAPTQNDVSDTVLPAYLIINYFHI